jgi:putative phosphoribosyl transferase
VRADDLAGPPGALSREVRISAIEIAGTLIMPSAPRGVIVFAQGSTSSRFDAGASELARSLAERGLATLLVDLLRWEEERDRTNVFDIRLLSDRVTASTRWAHRQPDLATLSIGYLGTGAGAAAALRAAAELGPEIAAVVSADGRPDLADSVLPEVRCPALLIVGSHDQLALELHREARRRLGGPSALALVPEAGRRFDDAHALDEVARLAGEWLARHLSG